MDVNIDTERSFECVALLPAEIIGFGVELIGKSKLLGIGRRQKANFVEHSREARQSVSLECGLCPDVTHHLAT